MLLDFLLRSASLADPLLPPTQEDGGASGSDTVVPPLAVPEGPGKHSTPKNSQRWSPVASKVTS